MEFSLKIFSKRVRDLRNDMGLTTTQLADAVGVKNATVSKWENALIVPKADSICSLAKVFNSLLRKSQVQLFRADF